MEEIHVGSTWKGVLALLLVACGGDNPTDTLGTGDSGVTDPDADGDGVTRNGGDCNDNDRMVYPGAAELCDGKDNDCDATTPESGVAFQPMSGPPEDRTAEFSAGTKTKPALIELTESGLYHVCDGTWNVSINVTAEGPTGLEGHRSSPEATLVLDGAGLVSGITIASATQFKLEAIEMANYVAEDKPGLGGALFCGESGAAVQILSARFTDNTASVAGGSVAIVDGCTAQMSDVTFTNGSAPMGGHLAVSDTPTNMPVMIDEGTFTNGEAVMGGSTAVSSSITPFADSDAVLRCRACVFEENRAIDAASNGESTASGGAMWLGGNAELQLQGGEFTNNTADAAGGAVVLQSPDTVKFDGATAEFSDTDFSNNRANKAANDVAVPAVAKGDYDFGAGTSAQCDEDDGCVEP